jgi:UrcA family protein
MSRTFVTVCLAALGLIAASPAAAGDGMIRVTETVRYSDLDLTTPKGAQVMLRRLEVAADRACAEPDSMALPRAAVYARQCRARMMPRALAQLHAPMVSAEYARLHAAELTQVTTR